MKKTKYPHIHTRIRDAYEQTQDYVELLHIVFPAAKFPKAFQAKGEGSAPGCVMAFGCALRGMGGWRHGSRVHLPPEREVQLRLPLS